MKPSAMRLREACSPKINMRCMEGRPCQKSLNRICEILPCQIKTLNVMFTCQICKYSILVWRTCRPDAPCVFACVWHAYVRVYNHTWGLFSQRRRWFVKAWRKGFKCLKPCQNVMHTLHLCCIRHCFNRKVCFAKERWEWGSCIKAFNSIKGVRRHCCYYC